MNRTRHRGPSKLCVVLWLSCACVSIAGAGDEVDYSAPYLVVENGELVTKYPAKSHKGNGVAPEDATGQAPGNASSAYVVYVAATIIGVCLLGLVLMIRRRAHQRNAVPDS